MEKEKRTYVKPRVCCIAAMPERVLLVGTTEPTETTVDVDDWNEGDTTNGNTDLGKTNIDTGPLW